MTESVFNRTGGPYLDIEEAKAREIKSARIEEREPDFSEVNLFPMLDHTVNIPVDPNNPDSVDAARTRIDDLISPKPQVTSSSAHEAPMSSPVLAVEASTEAATPFGQVKTEDGTPDNDAVEEEVNNSEELDSAPANADTTADINTTATVDTEAPSSNPDPIPAEEVEDVNTDEDPFNDTFTP